MSRARYLIGDTRAVIPTIPDGSIDLVLTSPPFFALRSYLADDDPAKAHEIGSEPTPGDFLDALLDVVEMLRPKLAPHGSIAFELGDTYGGSGGAGGDYAAGGMRAGQPAFTGTSARKRTEPRSPGSKYARTANPDFDGGSLRDRAADEDAGILPKRLRTRRHLDGFPLDKSMCLIPEMFRFALSYGFNPFTGREIEPWRVRNVVRWCRPNPPVGSLGDKFRPATSDIAIATIARDRYFDLDAVREPASTNTNPRTAKGVERRENTSPKANSGGNNNRDTLGIEHLHETRPPYDWWEVATEPYEGSHYATWPRKLLVRPILAMTPERVCTTCGVPSTRIVETNNTGQNIKKPGHPEDASKQRGAVPSTDVPSYADRVTIGWTDCGHDTWRRGVVLDPFAGSGTTLAVATGHGRDAIGIDLDHRNADLALERVGPMFLDVADLRPLPAVTA